MKKIELYAGCSIEKAYSELHKTGSPCCTEFNGVEITSEDSLDDLYIKITGISKEEFEKRLQEANDEYVRHEEEHKEKIPELTKHYCEEARGVILEDKLELWDKCVPIRLGDLYHGMELDCTLSIANIMGNEALDLETRMRKAYKEFNGQGHSGMSASLVMAMLREFCPYGNEISDAIKDFKYDNKENS